MPARNKYVHKYANKPLCCEEVSQCFLVYFIEIPGMFADKFTSPLGEEF